MLCRLSIQNYVLIDRLEMDLDENLNIITGETGAGKSILLGALALLLGSKNEGTTQKDATKSCVIEGVFDLTGRDLEPFFEENDIDYADSTVIRRMITSAGKSRAFINDMPVQLTLLRDLGSQLIDIHSQHQNSMLSSPDFRVMAIDTLAENGALLAEYQTAYGELQSAKKAVTQLREQIALASRDQEWLRYQVEELSSAKLKEGEDQQLESEFALLSNAETIGQTLGSVAQIFDDENYGVLPRLKEVEGGLLTIKDSYPEAEEMARRVRSTLEELKDLGRSVAHDSERIELDPQRLQKVSERMDLIYSLSHKHKVANLEELISLRDKYEEQLSVIDGNDEQLSKAEKQLSKAEKQALKLSSELHKSRAKVVKSFGEQMVSSLVLLGMPDTRFEAVLVEQTELSMAGADRVDFLFSANKTSAVSAVDKIASGGERSRVMLSLKVLLASRMKLPTIIFDEIDTGVSGRIADAMGGIIDELSQSMQVINITHLPQVASKGEAHYVVYKADGHTSIRRLDAEERVAEIAKMLSGSEITDAALEQAKYLLK